MSAIDYVTTGEICTWCDTQNEITMDYREVAKVLKGEADANLPLVHCKDCGKRLLPCSLCNDAIKDGIIKECTCAIDGDCPIENYWNEKFDSPIKGEEKMTEEKKTPTLDDIVESFYRKCHCNFENDFYLKDCSPCDYSKVLYTEHLVRYYKEEDPNWTPHCDVKDRGGCRGECLNNYVYDVATGKRDINKPLWNPPKVPEWFKVGAKLWRKSYNDWYTIKSLTPTTDVNCDGDTLFAIKMVASDGVEDEESLPYLAFTPEAPFSEAFRQLFYKRRAWHKKLKRVVEILEYVYEDNEVGYSYYDDGGHSISALEELHEEDFEEVKFELPEWFQDRAILLDEEGGLVEVVDYDAFSDCTVYVYYKPKGSKEEEDVISSYRITYEEMLKGNVFKPVKFRPYESLEELEPLLGKKLRFKQEAIGGAVTTTVETITSVEYDTFAGDTTINRRMYSFYTEAATDTTIDGLPIGVPVVDEELLNNNN